jgi:hypothetical protein
MHHFSSKENFLSQCQNRSVFTADELEAFWTAHIRRNKILRVLRFIFVKSLYKRLTLGFLWDNHIIEAHGGPRPFTQISDDQFEVILSAAQTDLSKYWR